MIMRKFTKILGAAFRFGAGTARVSSAQKQAADPATWENARSRLQSNFRQQKVSKDFVPGGGSLTNIGIKGDYSLRPNLSASVSAQSERWLFPVIPPNVSRNVTAAVQILFEPHKLFQHSAADAPAAALGTGDRP